ncbi:MAG TPA: CapA family protein [Bacteroidota bacterium]|nr:CapA family protein [Bacteroidota bacterium]
MHSFALICAFLFAFSGGLGLQDTLLHLTTSDSLGHRDSLAFVAPQDSVILLFGGDCLLTDHYLASVGDDVSWAFRDFDILRRADVAVVNLECPVTTRGTRMPKPFNFRMQPRHLSALRFAGIDIVNMANNHIFDYDRVGLFDTISYLDSVGIKHVGAGRVAAEAHRPVIIETKEGRVAFLGYYGGGEAPAAGRRTPGVARRELSLIQRDVEHARIVEHADYIVVNLHWGNEKAAIPDQWQQELAHGIIDAGANAVIGHHPHVLQGVEEYGDGVIAYSLGNFIFGGNSRSSYDTALFEIVLNEKGAHHRIVPVQVTNWQARELTGATADSLIEYVQSLSTVFADSIFHKPETK